MIRPSDGGNVCSRRFGACSIPWGVEGYEDTVTHGLHDASPVDIGDPVYAFEMPVDHIRPDEVNQVDTVLGRDIKRC